MPDGGYLVAGLSNSTGVNGFKVWVLRLDAAGNILWQKSYGGSMDEFARAMSLTSDGGFIVAADTLSFGVSTYTTWIVRFNSDGDILWQNTYNGGSINTNSISQTSEGGYIVGRFVDQLIDGSLVMGPQLLKLNPDGSVAWAKTYEEASPAAGGFFGPAITTQTSDGGFLLASTTGKFQGSPWVVKLDAMGNVVWQNEYLGTNDNFVSSAGQTHDGGFIIAAGTTGLTSATASFLRLNADGSVKWEKAYPIGQAKPEGFSIQQTTDDGFIVAGGTGTLPDSTLLLRLDPAGNIDWQQTYGQGVGLFSVQQTRNGGFVAAGARTGPGTGVNALFLKVNSMAQIHPCGEVVPFNGTIVNANATMSTTAALVIDSTVSANPTNALATATSTNTTVLCPSHDAPAG